MTNKKQVLTDIPGNQILRFDGVYQLEFNTSSYKNGRNLANVTVASDGGFAEAVDVREFQIPIVTAAMEALNNTNSKVNILIWHDADAGTDFVYGFEIAVANKALE